MLKILFLLLSVVLLFFARKALLPLLFAVTIAYLLNPYVSWLQKKLRIPVWAAIFTAYLTVITSVLFLIWGFAHIVTGEFASGTLTESVAVLKGYYLQYGSILSELFHISLTNQDLARLLTKFSALMLNFLIGSVMSIYLLKDKAFFLRLLSKIMHLLLPQKVHGILREILFDMDDVLSAFLRGVFVDSVIVAFLSSLSLTALDIDFSVFIGLFAGITNIIPYFGPLLGMVPAALAGMTQGGLTKAAAAVFSLFVVQQVECNIIYPKIVGKSTGLHPLFVLAAVSAAGFFGGLFWMILAVPIAGAVKVLAVKWAEAQ